MLELDVRYHRANFVSENIVFSRAGADNPTLLWVAIESYKKEKLDRAKPD
jgi:hypothetical protein